MKYKTTMLIILINVLMFMIININGTNLFELVRYGALNTHNIELIDLITYNFLHSSTQHFMVNMLIAIPLLFIIENQHSSRTTFIIYMVSGIVAGVIISMTSSGVITGASNCIFGMLGYLTIKSINKRNYLIPTFTFIFLLITLINTGNNDIGHISGLIIGITFKKE